MNLSVCAVIKAIWSFSKSRTIFRSSLQEYRVIPRERKFSTVYLCFVALQYVWQKYYFVTLNQVPFCVSQLVKWTLHLYSFLPLSYICPLMEKKTYFCFSSYKSSFGRSALPRRALRWSNAECLPRNCKVSELGIHPFGPSKTASPI